MQQAILPSLDFKARNLRQTFIKCSPVIQFLNQKQPYLKDKNKKALANPLEIHGIYAWIAFLCIELLSF